MSGRRNAIAGLVAALAAALVAVVAPAAAKAAASYTDIWFPDGEVDYFVEPDAWGMLTTITDVMDYLADHTPLDITEVTGTNAANLHFEGTWVAPNNGGYTYAYWDENRNDSLQKIRFDPNNPPSRGTVAHEFGHALGWPHEFQRDTRDDHVDVCFNVDPFNYKPVGTLYWPDPYYNLSPYDFASVMNDGYSSCVDTLPGENVQSRSFDGVLNLLSVHDINAIYRMHGEGLGRNDDGDRFGRAVSSGDYDGDGYKDVAVANVQNDALWLVFYRGVGTDASENAIGLKWMPWFKVKHDADLNGRKAVELATGDFNGDGIDDLAVGQPRYDDDDGRVSILFVNSLPSDTEKAGTNAEDFAPWGRQGVEYRIDLSPADYGLLGGFGFQSYAPRFGASLAAVRATNYRDDENDAIYHDLVIGAPKAGSFMSIDSSVKGAVVIVKGRVDESPANFDVTDTKTLWSPDPSAGFGEAVTGIPGRCSLPSQGSVYNADFIAVGAPDVDDERGAIHVYGCASTGTFSTLVKPGLLDSLYGVDEGSRFGHALAGFRIFDGHYRDHYVAVGQPYYVASTGLTTGRVALYEIDSAGHIDFESSFTPGTHSGDDEFGIALAVQQRKYSADYPTDGSLETYIGIGMPGTEVDGHEAGKVVIWRPFNEDGTNHNTASVVEAPNPTSSSTTRFGMSIAALRPLKNKGGFVAGAPKAVTLSDGVKAGIVATLQNGGGDFSWSTVRRNLNQETDGDKRPTN